MADPTHPPTDPALAREAAASSRTAAAWHLKEASHFDPKTMTHPYREHHTAVAQRHLADAAEFDKASRQP